MKEAQLIAWLAELDERNVDNVARTESYLALYRLTREHPPELPWVFMAHLVSRNAGYLMTDLRRFLDDSRTPAEAYPALENLFSLLERANYLIFWDAWHHVLYHLLGRTGELSPGRTPEFMRGAWRRYEGAGAMSAEVERRLVLDLVHNEQNFIERRVVHHPRFTAGLVSIELIEASGREKPIHFPLGGAEIRVGRFADLAQRISIGQRIFDEVLADRGQRDALYEWALEHPHTGSRAVYGGRPGLGLREAWPVAAVRAAYEDIHAAPEPDPLYP
jgi:hypothetical protein